MINLRNRYFRIPKSRPQPVRSSSRSWLAFFAESLVWSVVSGLVLVCLGCVAIFWGWSQRDTFLENAIRQTLSEKYAEWNVEFASAELDNRGRIVLTQVSVNPHAAAVPLCAMEGIRVTVDRDLLLNERQIDIQAIEINRPQLSVIRETSGAWNFQNLPATEPTDAAAPLIKIRDAAIALAWEHPEFERAIRVQVNAVDVDMTPDGTHRYLFEGVGREETLGNSEFSGRFDSLHQTWEISGQLQGLQIDQPLLQAAAMISPDANRMVAQMSQSHLHRWQKPEGVMLTDSQSARDDGSVIRSAELFENRTLPGDDTEFVSAVSVPPVAADPNSFLLKLAANLQFHCSRLPDQEPDFTLSADLVDGQLAHPDIPLPLDAIQGQIAVDRLGIRVTDMRLASGPTLAKVTGAWGWGTQSLPETAREEFLFELKNFRVTESTRDFLPTSIRNLFDKLQPEGLISIEFGLERGIDRPINFDLSHAEIRAASMRHESFGYPVTNISGTIVRTDHGIGPESWGLDFRGTAADQPVTLTGSVIDPGPNSELDLIINTTQLTVDEQLRRALLPKHRDILEYLGLTGRVSNLRCRLLKKPELGPKEVIRMEGDLSDATLNVAGFPLGIRQLEGHIKSDETGWNLSLLKGMHGDSMLSGSALIMPVGDEWRLDLDVTAQNASFNRDLYLALQHASPAMQRVWDMLRPSSRGTFDLVIDLTWLSADSSVSVAIPSMQIKDCEIFPTIFPWRIAGINSSLRVETNGAVRFQNLTAQHDQCEIATSGFFKPFNSFWQLKFEEMRLDDLLPDHEFLTACPTELRRFLEMVKMKQPVSTNGMLEFKGDYVGEVVTAAWDVREAVFNHVDFNPGIEINDVSGTIQFQGQVDADGVVTVPRGKMNVDSCWAMGYHVTNVKGPFHIDDKNIVLGSEKMFEADSPSEKWTTVSANERLTGRIFNGDVFLDLLTKRTAAMPYWLRCTLSRADLEQWAIQNNYGQADIKGEVNGYVDLAGDAVSTRNIVGNGRVQISPAALYELPVMFKMFEALRFVPVDETAFRNAYAQFRIMDEKFVFDDIRLLGNSISLLGNGTIRFDRTVDLDFVYRPPTRQGRINLASRVLSRLENVLPALFTVQVDGTLDLPRVNTQNGVGETVKGFTKVLEMRPDTLQVPEIMPRNRVRIQNQPQFNQPVVPAF